jgi:outer membrane protein assembly factor BamB
VGSGLLVALAPNGDISAWNTTNGSVAWHVTVGALSTREASGLPSPSPTLLIANQTIFILKTIPSVNSSSSNQSLLLALQTRDGQMLWQDIPRPNSGEATLSQSDSSLYLHTESTLYKLDASDGTLLWQRDLGGDLGGAVPPLEANNVVYVIENASLYALRATNGSQIWSYDFYDSGGSNLQMISPNVLLVTSEPSHYAGLWNFCPGDTEPYHALFAFNAQDGSIYWRYALAF